MYRQTDIDMEIVKTSPSRFVVEPILQNGIVLPIRLFVVASSVVRRRKVGVAPVRNRPVEFSVETEKKSGGCGDIGLSDTLTNGNLTERANINHYCQ